MPAPNSEFFKGPLTAKHATREYLDDLADALKISKKGQVKKDIRDRIEAHLAVHPELFLDPRFQALWAYRPQNLEEGRSKTSADKVALDQAEGAKPVKEATGAHKSLIDRGMPHDPPPRITRLRATRDPLGHASTDLAEEDPFGDGDVSSPPSTPRVPPPNTPPSVRSESMAADDVGENEPEVRDTLSGPNDGPRTPVKAKVSKTIVVAFQQLGSAGGNPVVEEVFVPTDSKLRITNRLSHAGGEQGSFVRLSELLPVAIENASTPMKQRGGRIGRIGFTGNDAKVWLGSIQGFMNGDQSKYLRSELVNTFELEPTKNEDTLRVARKGLGDCPTAFFQCLSPSSIASHGRYLCRRRQEERTVMFCRQQRELHPASTRASRGPDGEWKKAKTAGDVLPRVKALRQALEKLGNWGWERSRGGYQIPDGHEDAGEFAGREFTKQEVLAAMQMGHSSSSNDVSLFKDDVLEQLPKLQDWYDRVEKSEHHSFFRKMKISDFKRYQKKELEAAAALRVSKGKARSRKRRQKTAWFISILDIIRRQAQADFHQKDDVDPGLNADEARDLVRGLSNDMDVVFEFLGVTPGSHASPLHPPPPLILCTTRVECARCPVDVQFRSLRRREKFQTVRVLTADFHWREGYLYAAHCRTCRTDHYPDRYTYPNPDGSSRVQCFEYDAPYLRVSKTGVWVERAVATAQEHSLLRFRAGWSNFANWVNDILSTKPHLTARQSYRIFIEHFARRLLRAHRLDQTFTVSAELSAPALAKAVRNHVDAAGGVLPGALEHGCSDCTHLKRYLSDLTTEGFEPEVAEATNVAEVDLGDHGEVEEIGAHEELPGGGIDPPPPPHAAVPGEPRGYVRMAVMDGKTITHQVSFC
ncbi:hypothetical protein C8Q80DRAFT_1266830 [Daedaleopsis nitida]|nr:hypothetical protein C8Q80DRAFT_1266830 [Daedaleopsis nitida]